MRILIALFTVLVSVSAIASDDALIAEKMDRASALLIGKPYLGDPLGEGSTARFDRDPRLRTDGFDCTTYIETVIAVAKSATPEEVPDWMDAIRYKNGYPSFETRNHFPGLDWIRNNVESGLLEDVTFRIAPGRTAIAEALIERDEWFKLLSPDRLSGVPADEKPARLAELRSLGDRFGKEIERVPYIIKSELLTDPDLVARIPHGAVINLVRPAWDLRDKIGTRLNISHQGLAFHKNGTVYLRHASTTGSVVEVPITTYLENARSIAGINVLVVH